MVEQQVLVPPPRESGDDRAGGEGAGGSEPDTAARLREVQPMVRGICRGRLGTVDGDDAAQRALVGVWRALERGREVASLESYAAACARYAVLESYRECRRHPRAAGDLAEQLWADEAPGPAEHVERVHEAAHATERVEALLTRLPAGEAEVIRATVLAERSNADAAAVLGLTPNSVRTKRNRAMARLREVCGTTSTNPLALNRSFAERAQRRWAVEKARRAARRAADGSAAPDAADTAADSVAPPAEPDRDERAAELIAAGVGRRRLSRELGISEWEARQLMARTPAAAEHGPGTSTDDTDSTDRDAAPERVPDPDTGDVGGLSTAALVERAHHAAMHLPTPCGAHDPGEDGHRDQLAHVHAADRDAAGQALDDAVDGWGR